MNYFPYENYKLISKLSVEEIKKRLTDNMESNRSLRDVFFGVTAKKIFDGKLTGDSFKMVRIFYYRNSFRPTIIGKIEKDVMGTIIHIKMRMVIFVYIFMSIWLGGVTFGALMMLLQKQYGAAAAVFFLFFSFGYGLMTGGFKSESRKTKKIISDLFEADKID